MNASRVAATLRFSRRFRRQLRVLEPGEQLKRQRDYAGRQLRRRQRLGLHVLVGGFGRHTRARDLQNLLRGRYVVGAILFDVRRDRCRDLRAGADLGKYGCKVHDDVLFSVWSEITKWPFPCQDVCIGDGWLPSMFSWSCTRLQGRSGRWIELRSRAAWFVCFGATGDSALETMSPSNSGFADQETNRRGQRTSTRMSLFERPTWRFTSTEIPPNAKWPPMNSRLSMHHRINQP